MPAPQSTNFPQIYSAPVVERDNAVDKQGAKRVAEDMHERQMDISFDR